MTSLSCCCYPGTWLHPLTSSVFLPVFYCQPNPMDNPSSCRMQTCQLCGVSITGYGCSGFTPSCRWSRLGEPCLDPAPQDLIDVVEGVASSHLPMVYLPNSIAFFPLQSLVLASQGGVAGTRGEPKDTSHCHLPEPRRQLSVISSIQTPGSCCIPGKNTVKVMRRPSRWSGLRNSQTLLP